MRLASLHLADAADANSLAGSAFVDFGGSMIKSIETFSSLTAVILVLAPRLAAAQNTVVAGEYHSCALTPIGVTCWGRNGERQLEVPPNLGHVSTIAAGTAHTCAAVVDGDDDRIVCWGLNDHGQSTAPQHLSGVRELTAGASHVGRLQ